MSKSENRVIWSSKVKLSSISSTEAIAAEYKAAAESLVLKHPKTERDNDVNSHSHKNSAENVETKKIVSKVENLEFSIGESTKKNADASVQSDCTADHSVFKYYMTKNKQKNLIDEHKKPHFKNSPQNTELNSSHFLVNDMGEDIDKDSDTDSEIDEFLDNDEEITIPKYNDIGSSELLPSSAVCDKEASSEIIKNGMDKKELQNFPSDEQINDTSKDVSDSETTDDNEDIKEKKAYRKLNKFITYICPRCGKTCRGIHKWKQHTNTKHKLNAIAVSNMEIKTNSDGKRIRKCRYCDFESAENVSPSKSLRHCISHLPYRKYCICNICSTGFSDRNILFAHLKKTHTKLLKMEKPYKNSEYLKYVRARCPLCFEHQENNRRTNVHLELKHDYYNQVKTSISFNEDSITCNVCNLILRKKDKSSLVRHMLEHEPNKSFICELCDSYESAVRRRVVGHIKAVHFD